MISPAVAFFLLGACSSAVASPIAASNAGATTSNVYPPPSATVNTALLPDESVIGYPGITVTGLEPFAAQTAAAGFPSHTNIYPLVVPAPYQTLAASSSASTPAYGAPAKNVARASDFLSAKYWGNLSPQRSIDSSVYGLTGASPAIPETCEAVQVHYYYRHGARYPTTGAAPSAFAAKVHNASATGFTATGPLSFLNTWTYKLGAELLTPFGRAQNFDLGVGARVAYGALLNNFTAAGKLPVFRTQSQDRMVKTAKNFAAGFFGVPEYVDQVEISIEVEAVGLNASGAPYEVCTNSNNARGSVGSTAATNYTNVAYQPALKRLQSWVTGINFTVTDVGAMLQLCAYETDALGYSKFCEIFTEDDFKAFEHSFDISFYGNNGFGSPVAAAQGLGYLQELVARLSKIPITKWNSETNSTLDGSNVTFPLDQAFYADAAHEVSILDAMTAINLTALAKSGPPSVSSIAADQTFVASQIVPFATNMVVQVLECQASSPTKQIRFIVNDAVVPLEYEGCKSDFNGLCAFDTVLAALQKRIAEIDYNYDCFGNWTVPTYGKDFNGRAPK
ncbi:putative acid phosphatase [Meredithblackwellia eburnea MCA 4105]